MTTFQRTLSKTDKPSTGKRIREDSNIRQGQIVHAVLDLLDEVGPEGVTTTAIARRIGMSQASIFKHFNSKADIWRAAVDEIGVRVEKKMTEAATMEGNALSRVRATLRAYVSAIEATPGITAFLFYSKSLECNVEIGKAIAERSERERLMLRDLFINAQAEHVINRTTNVDHAATLCMGVVQALSIRHHLDETYRPVEEFDNIFSLLNSAWETDQPT